MTDDSSDKPIPIDTWNTNCRPITIGCAFFIADNACASEESETHMTHSANSRILWAYSTKGIRTSDTFPILIEPVFLNAAVTDFVIFATSFTERIQTVDTGSTGVNTIVIIADLAFWILRGTFLTVLCLALFALKR